jgi:WD40 repeat protein/DNA-binding SARP family transcriptional activator/energy-coupling factor transporter ATP-binding protein EcfA2
VYRTDTTAGYQCGMAAPPSDDAPVGLGRHDPSRLISVDEPGPTLHIRGVRVAQGARIAVLGPLKIDGAQPRITPRDRVVLEALAIRAGDSVTTDSLTDALWGDTPPRSATKNLQGCIARLRKVLGHDAIETTASGYRLALPRDDIDSLAFEHLVERSRELVALGASDRAAYVVDEALAMFSGDPLEDLAGWDLGLIEADRLRELKLSAEELRTDALLGTGQHEEALPRARALVSEQPLRERRHVQLALAQYRSGQQADALATLRLLRQHLLDELGVDPGSEATELERLILQQDPHLLVAAPSGAGTTCPWPGLTSYDVEDQESFCGRDTETAACLRLLHERGVLAVVGPSGSGKSSLLRAGIAASLKASGRQVHVVTPGRAGPTESDSIERAAIGTVLLIDQLEEVFAPGVCPEHRDAYLTALARRGGGGELVVALRADRTPELSGEPRIARLLERGWYLLSAMDADELRTAIERPARQVGLLVEPGLTDLLLREVQDEPGALPLLSHSLVETWNRREGRTLTVDGYLATGGIRGSIAQSAESVYSDVPPDQRDQLRDLLMRLVAPGPEGEPTRIRISRDRIVTRPEQEHLVELLVGSRLLTSDDGNITLAHEALAREWPRLRGWLDDDLEGQRILHHLAASADAWQAMDRPDSELYRGVRLARAHEWRASAATELAPVEQDFLDESLRLRSAEERSADERIRAQARVNRRLRSLLAAAVVLVVVATGLGFLAQRNADRAQRSARAREAEAVGALALQTPDPPKSLLLAAAAAQVAPSASTQADLVAALAEHSELVRTAASPGPWFGSVAVSPDGSRMVAGTSTGSVYLYDARTLRLLSTYRSGPDVDTTYRGVPVAFSPDGHSVAVGATAPSALPLRLLSLRGDRLTPLSHQLGGWSGLMRVSSIGYSADGHRLAVFADRGALPWGSEERRPTALVWSTRRPDRPIPRIAMPLGQRQKVTLSPDGSRLYITAPAAVYDVATGRAMVTDGPYSWVYGALNPSGHELALLGFPSTQANNILLVDARTLRVRATLEGMLPGYASSVTFSPDGRQVAAFDNAGTAYVWDARSGQLTHKLPTNDSNARALAFSPDGSRLYTAGGARQLQEWDLAGRHSLVRRVALAPRDTNGWDGVLSPNGTMAAYFGGNEHGNAIHFVGVSSGDTTPTRRVPGQAAAMALSWSPDSSRYAVAVANRRLGVFDPRTARVVGSVRTDGTINDVGYSADGRRLVVAAGGELVVLDARTLQPVVKPVRLGVRLGSVDPGPDGTTAFVTFVTTPMSWHAQPRVTTGALVDLDSGAVLHRGPIPIRNARFAAFSPRGDQVAVVGDFGQVLIFDTDTWHPVAPTYSPNGPITLWVTYSSDGSRVLTAAADQVQLWDAATGQEIGVASVPGVISSATFRSDGTVRIADNVGRVFSWDPSLAHDITFACHAAGRDITPDEWRAAFPDLAYRKVCAA